VGVLARVFEEHGLVTTSISLIREHTEKVRPPRALFVPFPFGHPLGEANDTELQAHVMRAALGLLDREAGPVMEDYPEDIYSGQDINLAQASNVAQPGIPTDVAFEVTTLRPYYEQWVAAHAGRTGVGVTRVDERRFRGLVRLLEAYAEGREVDVPEWNREVALPQFVRWSADDLKAFYLEARMEQKPASSFQELNGWLWSETALSNLLRAVRDRMRAQGDARLDAIAFGIAR
jgi:hypothetical protein